MRCASRSVVAPRSVPVLLFVLSLVSNLYFIGNFFNANAISHAALAVALVEHGTTSTDSLADILSDTAIVDGHYYSDKAPGMSFLALPAVAAFIAIFNPHHDDRLWHEGDRPTGTFGALIAVCTVFTASLLTAISVPLIFSIATQWGASLRGAIAVAVIAGEGTPIWFWATDFFSHSAAAALLVIGFHALLRALDEDTGRKGWWAFWSGTSLGWATLVEFPAAIPTAMLMIFAFLQARRSHRVFRCVGLIAIGGLPALGLLLAYHAAAFGSPFELGYSHVAGFEGMQTGFHGIGAPSLSVLEQITLGSRRGILWLSPVLALAPAGLACAMLSPRWRGRGMLCALIVVYYLLLNSGYAYWDGGNSTGPRHLTAALPFACLVLVPLWERGGSVARSAITVLGAASGVACLVAVSVSITMPHDLKASMFEFLLPRFRAGEFDGGLAFVLYHLGWPGPLPVLPFILGWALIAAALVRATAYQPNTVARD